MESTQEPCEEGPAQVLSLLLSCPLNADRSQGSKWLGSEQSSGAQGHGHLRHPCGGGADGRRARLP